MNPTIRIVMIEDDKLLTHALLSAIRTLGNNRYCVSATATTAREGRSQVVQHQPDLVLLDIDLPDMQGTDIIRKLKDRSPAPKVLVMTHHDHPETVRLAIREGADGYFLKGAAGVPEFVEAIGKVVAGEGYLSPSIHSAVFNTAEATTPVLPENLSADERAFARYVAAGKRYQEISELLDCSVSGVERIKRRTCTKTNSANLYQLAAWAGKNGLC